MLYWCKNCNIPIHRTKCSACDNTALYFAMDARPVFPEEIILLEVLLHMKGKLINQSVWNTKGNRYYVNGERLDFSVQRIIAEWDGDLAHTLYFAEIQKGVDYGYFRAMVKKFCKANSVRLTELEYDSVEFIGKTVEAYKGRIPVVSFSGGKDSTVVSSLVRRTLGTEVMHVFGDTTLEFPMTYEYIERFRDKNRRTPVVSSMVEHDFFEMADTIGPPSRVMRWCCTIFKTGPIYDIMDRFTQNQNALTFYGIRRSESTRRSKYDEISNSPKIAKQIVASPIMDWVDADVWLYLLSYGEDFNDAYRLGFSRVGCWVCPSNSDWAFFLNKVLLPDLSHKWWNFLVNFAERIGKPDAEEYVDSGNWKARQGGNGMGVAYGNVEFEPCATGENARNFNLTKPITRQLYEYFKPFGKLNFDIGRKLLGEVFLIGRKTKEPLLILQGQTGQNHLKIIIDKTVLAKEYPKKSYALMEDWIDCQLRKYQSCITCGGCPPVCKQKAISVTSEEYIIDSSKCTGCMECIAHYDKGCLVAKVTQTRRNAR